MGDMEFNGTPEEWDALVKRNKMRQEKWDNLHKELDDALDSEFGSEEELKLESVFENAKLALRKYISDNKEKVADDLDEMKKKSKTKTMKIEKKKPGGLRKVKKPVITVPNQAEIDLEHAQKVITARNEAIADLETKLDEAYVEQEQMIKEIDKWIFQVMHHCAEVESNTGRITLHDVDYCVDLIKRIMKHKFESKSENY
jgi:superoxide dismutase